MKQEIVVSFPHTGNQLLQLLYRPLIHLVHVTVSDTIFIRVEIIKISQKVSQSIPDFPIRVLRSPDQLIVAPDVLLIIHTRHPQPKNIRTVLAYLLLRIYIVA